jgi:5-methylthioadenosine/S-adenosylhomocysteine deaminase
MVTYGGANSLLLADQIGSVEIGKKADLITLNINQPHLYPTHNLLNTLVEAATAGDVNDVIINGRVVMKDRNVLTLDEEKIMGEAKTRLLKIAKRANLN